MKYGTFFNFRTAINGSIKTQKDTLVPSCPTGLPLYDEIRTHFEQNPDVE